MPSSGDKSNGFLPFLSSVVHVPSPPSADSPVGPLQHEARSADQADSPVIFSGPVICGLLVSVRTSLPGAPSPTSSPHPPWTHPIMDGYSVWSLVGQGYLVKRCWSPYQLSPGGECFHHLEDIPEVAMWNSYPDSDRLHYGDALPEWDGGWGGYKVQQPGRLGGWVNQAYSRLSTTHGHITDCKLDSVVYVGV